MIPLRIFSIVGNVVLFAMAIPSHNYLVMVVQTAMLGVNSYRLHQMLQLVRDVKKSVNSDLSMEWLKPFMTERKCAAGEVLFYKDEKGRGHALHRQRPVQARRIRHRTAGGSHCRRIRHAVAV
jgi:hypothetical protein